MEGVEYSIASGVIIPWIQLHMEGFTVNFGASYTVELATRISSWNNATADLAFTCPTSPDVNFDESNTLILRYSILIVLQHFLYNFPEHRSSLSTAMDVQIEERDEAGNLIATYAGSSSTDEKGRSGGRWDVIVCRWGISRKVLPSTTPPQALVLLEQCSLMF